MYLTETPSFCVIPWIEIATTARGHVRPCCHMSGTEAYLRDANGRRLKFGQSSVEDIWQSPTYRQLRKDFLNGKRPAQCRKCWQEEDAGVTSYRMIANSFFKLDSPPTETPPLKVRYLDLRLGNLCNLKCRTCNPVSSSAWVKDWPDVQRVAQLTGDGEVFSQESLKELENLNWADAPETRANLVKVIDTVEQIYFTGGEPSLIQAHYDLLDDLLNGGRANQISLKYHLNLTHLPDRLLEAWKHFKDITVNCSIDGVGKLNDYIRYPSRWATVERNLEKLLESNLAKLNISHTVQIYNIFNLSEIYDLARKYEIGIHPILVHQPKCYSIKALSEELKSKARDLLSSSNLNSEYFDAKQIIEFMDNADWSAHFGEFVEITKKLDKLRNQDFCNLVPHFSEFFEDDR